MINEVRDHWSGEIVGFRCHECFGVFPSMWGDICNGCREKERRHKEMIAALRPAPEVKP